VLRLLDKERGRLEPEKLGMAADTLAGLDKLVNQPHGIVLVTGPTGSGKTTTLYAMLSRLEASTTNIMTVEDPIEYDLEGIGQTQVNTRIDMSFARALRAFLRQDPDVMLVGETRDKETAHTAVEAALTGHLVFTTLHTNSAAVAFTRLTEMGIEPFLVSSSTVGVIAQRLARRLCQQCKEPYEAEETTCRFFQLTPGTTIYRARGCTACDGKGLKGRIGIYEVMKMNPELRQMVGRGALAEEIHAAALGHGMIDLKGYSALLLTEGLTTVDEVTSVVSIEG
jgi:general secretion pathway protein E